MNLIWQVKRKHQTDEKPSPIGHFRNQTQMASNGQDSHGGQPPGNQPPSGLWPLASLQSRYTRSAMDMAQELLPNLPRRALNIPAAAPRSSQPMAAAEGQVSVDMSSLLARDGDEGEQLTISPQVSLV